MILLLQHLRPDGDVDTYHLKPGRRYHLGRGSACEVRILDLRLSRKHCAFDYDAGEWRVTDMASTNGCTVDGDQIVGARSLQPGNDLLIGSSQLKVLRILGEDEEFDESSAHAVPSLPPAINQFPALSHQRCDARGSPITECHSTLPCSIP